MLSLGDSPASSSVAAGVASFVVPRIKIEPPPPSDSPSSDSPTNDEALGSQSPTPLAATGLAVRGLSLDSALDGGDGIAGGHGGGAAIDLRRQPGKFKKCLHHRFLHQAYSEERAASVDGPYGHGRHYAKRSRSFDNATERRHDRGAGPGADDDDDCDDYDRPLDLSVTGSSLDVRVTTATRNIFEARARERHMRRRSEPDEAPSADLLLRAWLDAPGSGHRLVSASSRFSYSDLQLSSAHRRDDSIGGSSEPGREVGGSGDACLSVRSQRHHHQYRLTADAVAPAAAKTFIPFIRPAPVQQMPTQHQHLSTIVKHGSFSNGVGFYKLDAGPADDRIFSTYEHSFKFAPFGMRRQLDGADDAVSPAAASWAQTPSVAAAAATLDREQFSGLAGRPVFNCQHCQQTFPTYDSLAKHASKHLPAEAHTAPPAALSVALYDGSGGGGGGRLHSCKVCDRSFSRSDMLTRHMRLHTGLKPYECQLCGQLFSRSDHLNTHQRTHTGERPYRCPHCLYSACRRDMITRHMRIHGRDLKAKRRRMLVYLRSERGGGGEAGGSGGSLSSGAESYESSSGGASRSANSSADSGSFDNAAAVVVAAAAAAAYSGEQAQWAARRLLLPPRGDGPRQREWLGCGSLWGSSLTVAGIADGGGAAAAAATARRLLSPSWSRTSSDSMESDSSGRPGAAAAKSRSASPRDTYSDGFDSDAGVGSGGGGERSCERQPRLSPSPSSSSLPTAPSAASSAAPARRGLVRQDASLELEEEEDDEFTGAMERCGREASMSPGEHVPQSRTPSQATASAAAAAGVTAAAYATAAAARWPIKCSGMPTEATLFAGAVQSPQQPHLGLTQPMSSLRVQSGAPPPRQSSLSDDLGKCQMNE